MNLITGFYETYILYETDALPCLFIYDYCPKGLTFFQLIDGDTEAFVFKYVYNVCFAISLSINIHYCSVIRGFIR